MPLFVFGYDGSATVVVVGLWFERLDIWLATGSMLNSNLCGVILRVLVRVFVCVIRTGGSWCTIVCFVSCAYGFGVRF